MEEFSIGGRTMRGGAWAWSLTPSVMLEERSLLDNWLCGKQTRTSNVADFICYFFFSFFLNHQVHCLSVNPNENGLKLRLKLFMPVQVWSQGQKEWQPRICPESHQCRARPRHFAVSIRSERQPQVQVV